MVAFHTFHAFQQGKQSGRVSGKRSDVGSISFGNNCYRPIAKNNQKKSGRRPRMNTPVITAWANWDEALYVFVGFLRRHSLSPLKVPSLNVLDGGL
jgi:hypothetical protein